MKRFKNMIKQAIEHSCEHTEEIIKKKEVKYLQKWLANAITLRVVPKMVACQL